MLVRGGGGVRRRGEGWVTERAFLGRQRNPKEGGQTYSELKGKPSQKSDDAREVPGRKR